MQLEFHEGDSPARALTVQLWRSCAESRPGISPFLHPEWTLGIHRSCQESGTPVHLIGRSNGVIVAYAALKRVKSSVRGFPIKTYKWLGERMCDYHDVLCPNPDHLEQFLVLIARRLESTNCPLVLQLPQIPSNSPLIPAFRRVSETFRGWFDETSTEGIVRVDLNNAVEQRLRGRLKYVDWCERRLAKDGHAVTFFAIDAKSQSFGAVLAEFAELHGRRMAAKNLVSPYRNEALSELITSYGQSVYADGVVVELAGLRVGERLLAGHLGFYTRDTYFYLHPAFDDGFRSVSPGQMLLGRLIRHAVSLRLASFDLLRGLEDYKLHWGEAQEGCRCLTLVPGTLRGLAARAILSKRREAIAERNGADSLAAG